MMNNERRVEVITNTETGELSVRFGGQILTLNEQIEKAVNAINVLSSVVWSKERELQAARKGDNDDD